MFTTPLEDNKVIKKNSDKFGTNFVIYTKLIQIKKIYKKKISN